MTRRELLKTAGVFTAMPIIFPNIVSPNIINAPMTATGLSNIKHFNDGRDWFFKKRFGMFVHWGLYAIPGWHEQLQWRGKVERNEYVKLAKHWDPVRFNPEKWLDLMEEVGMEYITITTKHHDGFCLWDTKQTTFNTMNTPYKKDIIGMLADACQKRKIPLSLYYSIADWNHPNYPNEGRHHELMPQPQDSPDWNKYLEFLKEQVRELCTNYGEIHGFWWDMNVPKHIDPSINNMIRRLQPNAVINDRGFDDGDFGTPERDFKVDDSIAFSRPTEACQSVGIESWGYRKNEDFYTDKHLIRSIDRYLALDSNYLLNMGPMADGTFPKESMAILKRIGKWYKSVKESLKDVKPMPTFTDNQHVMVTVKDRVVYVHLNKELPGNVIKLSPINVAPEEAILLNNGRKIDFAIRFNPSDHNDGKAYLNLINLPVNEFCNTVLVIKLLFKKSLDNLVLPNSPFDGVV